MLLGDYCHLILYRTDYHLFYILLEAPSWPASKPAKLFKMALTVLKALTAPSPTLDTRLLRPGPNTDSPSKLPVRQW